MTKEEAKNILEKFVKGCEGNDFDLLTTLSDKEIFDAVKVSINILSSLPSNLDEAAEGEIKDFRLVREINYSSAKIEFNSIPKLKEGDKVRIIIVKED
jgi:hypothetical protein